MFPETNKRKVHFFFHRKGNVKVRENLTYSNSEGGGEGTPSDPRKLAQALEKKSGTSAFPEEKKRHI